MTLGKSEQDTLFYAILIAGTAMLLFHLFRKSHILKPWFDRWIEKIGNRIMFGKKSNPITYVEDYGDMVVAQVYLQNIPQILKDIPLSHSPLMDKYNIMVMMIKGEDGTATQATADTVLSPNDIIMVLGKRLPIREVFEKV